MIFNLARNPFKYKNVTLGSQFTSSTVYYSRNMSVPMTLLKQNLLFCRVINQENLVSKTTATALQPYTFLSKPRAYVLNFQCVGGNQYLH